MEEPASIASPAIKIATAWGAVGITSWADAASFLATLYTAVLLVEWIWKKAIKPALQSRGLWKWRK
jgi:hypothetical protein